MIDNSKDIIDTRDIEERIRELEDQQTDRWVAGWNMPGYMPDSEPAEFDDFDDAKDYIADEMESQADLVEENWNQTHEDEPCQDAEEIRKTAEHVRNLSEGEYGETVDNYHYFITQDGKMGLDEDEQEELRILQEVKDEVEGYCDWKGGEGLIRDSYFENYAQELAENIGAVERNVTWPPIDWERAAEELKMDYTSVDFDGVEYWVRCS